MMAHDGGNDAVPRSPVVTDRSGNIPVAVLDEAE